MRKGLYKMDNIADVRLCLILLHNAAGIVTTEAEGVAQSSTYGALLCLVEGEVEVVVDVLVAIVVLVVDRRRHDVVLYREAAEDGLYSTCSTEKVPRHTLGRRDVELISVLAKELGDGLYL